MAANITLLDIEELKKTKLKPYIEKSLELRAPDPAVHTIMGHNIDDSMSIHSANRRSLASTDAIRMCICTARLR